MKKILLVDDEVLARQRLRRFLGDGFLIEEAANGPEALDKIKSFSPELIFLDIQMPGMDGFEVLRNVGEKNFHVIFQTAYDEFALRAFEASAVDYLLKPFTQDRFNLALKKAQRAVFGQEALVSLGKKLIEEKKYLDKILIKQSGKTRVILVSEVECFVSRDHYTFVYTESGEWICELSLTKLEAELDPQIFVRNHRGSIVRTTEIKTLGPTTDSFVELRSGRRLPLARAARQEVRHLLK